MKTIRAHFGCNRTLADTISGQQISKLVKWYWPPLDDTWTDTCESEELAAVKVSCGRHCTATDCCSGQCWRSAAQWLPANASQCPRPVTGKRKSVRGKWGTSVTGERLPTCRPLNHAHSHCCWDLSPLHWSWFWSFPFLFASYIAFADYINQNAICIWLSLASELL